LRIALPDALNRALSPPLARLQANEQIADAAAVTLSAVGTARLDLNGHAEKIGSLDSSGTVMTSGGRLDVEPGAAGAVSGDSAFACKTRGC
jgi:hypothetical protein